MKRREFITLIGGAAVAWPRALIAQPTDRVRRVGVLSGSIDYGGFPAFQNALRELGWAEGRNLRLDFRQGAGEVEQVQTFAKELVDLQPDVIVAGGTPSLTAFLHETRTIPIVFVMVGDPVGQGMIQSLARPTGNVTGFTNFEFSMGTKWLELLKEVAPHVTRIGVIFNPQTSPGGASYFLRPIETAAASFAVEVTAMPAHDDSSIEAAITAFAAQPGGGLITIPDVFPAAHREIIINLVAGHRVPAIYPLRHFVTSGGLMSYGVDLPEQYRQAASYVGRIIKGAKPADLPVQSPTKFELLINLKAAKVIGLTVPPSLLARADEVIE